jgi:NADH-quinone oxidoreductase subunit N
MNGPAAVPLTMFAPEIPVALALAAALVLGMKSRPGNGLLARGVGAAGVLAGLFLLFWGPPYTDTWLVRAGGVAKAWQVFFHLAALAFLASHPARGERPVALLLGALLGMDLIAAANDLFALFIGLELMSLPVYLLVAGLRPGRRGLEAAIKYFFAGSAASGLFLFGLSIWYAATGTTALAPGGPSSAGTSLALALMGSAALFKIGAFPFRSWVPDVYEASEPELTAFMSTAVNAAGVLTLMLLSIGHSSFDPLGDSGASPPNLGAWLPAVSIATMTLGNLLALRQRNVRRLLAYSSIAHAGALLAAVWVWQARGHGAELATVWFYLGAYLFMNTGAFLFLKISKISEVEELRGYGARAPWPAAFFALMLFSLGAVPPTAGFLAKLYVLWDLLKGGGVLLAAAVALNSLLGLGYYLSLVRTMTLEEPGPRTPEEAFRPNAAEALVLLCCAGATLAGFIPTAREWLFTLLTL